MRVIYLCPFTITGYTLSSNISRWIISFMRRKESLKNQGNATSDHEKADKSIHSMPCAICVSIGQHYNFRMWDRNMSLIHHLFFFHMPSIQLGRMWEMILFFSTRIYWEGSISLYYCTYSHFLFWEDRKWPSNQMEAPVTEISPIRNKSKTSSFFT